MRLGIHAATLRGFGSGAVGRGLIDSLGDRGGDSFVAWIPKEWPAISAERDNRFEVHRTRAGLVSKLFVENVAMRSRCVLGGLDCMLSLGDTSLPFAACPHVLMVQTPYLAYEEKEWGFHPSSAFRMRVGVIERYFALARPSISKFVVQTQVMKRRLASRWRLVEDRIAVVPSAIDMRQSAEVVSREGEETRSSCQSPYLFYPASGSPHKAHWVLPRMLSYLASHGIRIPIKITVRQSEFPLVAEEARRLGVERELEFLGPLSFGQTKRLMSEAFAVVNPSVLETFGLPYFEAMSLGRPLVVSDLDFAHEACGDAAVYARANDGESFGECVLGLIRDDALCSRLVACARQRASSNFSWDDVGKAMWDVIASV